ncbi:MAG: AbrB/MazE/SpoVT family DNA-binding domain-containing protein [Candidatus Woesearchaeota archaeon]|nr:AbrB/MazE/SpoVT family DNA-binding domain-containing protein [Candidatus Woesearchaeota archaeon]
MELVKMSAKGQLVVPEEIRKKESFESGDRFIAVAVEDGVVFKRINVRAELERLAKETRAHFRKNKVTKKVLDEAIQWARKPS